MARDITVTFADGTTHVYKNAPDEITPEDVSTRASQEFGKAVQALDGGRDKAPVEAPIERAVSVGLPTSPEEARGAAETFLRETPKVIGSGLYGGATALPRMVMAGGDWLESALPTPDFTKIPIPGYEVFADADARIQGALRPETKGGQAAARVLEAGTAGLLGPGMLSAPARMFGTGVAAGLGAEGAAAAFGDSALTRGLGGLTGGLLGGIATAAKTNRGALAREALEGVREDDLMEAMMRMEQARRAGVPINLSQAMPRASNIDAYVDALATSRHGKQTIEQLRNQPGQIVGAGQRALGEVPGEVLPNRILSNEAQDAATAAIERVKRARTRAWERTLATETQKAGGQLDVPQAAVAAAYQKLGQLAADVPNTPKAQMLTALQSRLVNGDQGFLTDPRQLNEVLKAEAAALSPVNLATKGVDAGTAKYVGKVIGELRDDFGKAFEPIRKANTMYQVHTENFVNPMKRSVTGDIAGRTGAHADINAPQGKLFALFDRGTAYVPGQAKRSEILTFEKDLRKAGQQETFINAGKTWLADRFAKAIGPGEAGSRAPEAVAANLLKVFGDPRGLKAGSPSVQAQGLDDVLAGMARAQGVPDAQFVKGFKNFMQVVTDAARRPKSTQGVNVSDIREAASEGLTRRLGQFSVMTPIRQPALRWAKFLEADSLSTMDRLLTSPEGVAMLVKLGKQPPFSSAAVTTISTFLGTNAAVQAGETPAN